MSDTATIESKAQFASTPAGQQQRWTVEIAMARDNQKEWWADAEKVVKRYLGEREGKAATLNLFHSNVNTVLAMLYGQLPSVDVSRRFGDATDDDARVGGEMLERVLQTDLEREDDGFTSALRYNLQDWKVPGLGQSWLRYVVEMGKVPAKPAIPCDCDSMSATPMPMMGASTPSMPGMEAGMPPGPHMMPDGMMMGGGPNPMCQKCRGTGEQAPAIPEHEEKTHEDVETDYVYWRDFLWSPSRTWHEVTWVAKRAEMTRDELKKRFGEEKATKVKMQKRDPTNTDGISETIKDAWTRGEVYEIWDKTSRKRFMFSEGMDEILEVVNDPLGLQDFWPCPRPLIANATTSKLLPKPDFYLAEHLYNEIDDLSRRIKNLEDCAKVRFAYDKNNLALGRMFSEAEEGEGIPVENWAVFIEKGAVAGSMQFAPLREIAETIALLTEKRQEKVAFLYQITGLSDIVRGQAMQKATATEQKIKAGFASTRLQTEQDEVARFASDVQKIRAEIVSKHFDPKTLVERSNILRTKDAPRAQQGAEFIKGEFWQYRVDVKADSIALRDYASLKQERVETVQTLSALFKETLPVVQMFPPFGPFMLAVGEWLIAATKGSQQLEADFDTFRAQAEQAAQAAMQPKPPPPDPKVEGEKIKLEGTKMKAQADMAKTKMDMQFKGAEHQMKMQELAATVQANQQNAKTRIMEAQAMPEHEEAER